ncbi:MAG: DUF1802 family protein [Chthoniobacterales bacterium]|nr:DUF1802 family protein [Chthoniobacterales bacterium]
MESIGFKEWALVCEALGRGEQSIILRKGGVAEGQAGFAFKHREFFLFPTFFHEQVEKVRTSGAQLPKQQEGQVEIRYFAKLEASHVVTSWEAAAALEPWHILQAEVVRERFAYDDAPGIDVAFVRVFRLQPSWTLPDERRFGGCRSWVNLPSAPPFVHEESVLGDEENARRLADFEAALRGSSAPRYVPRGA